MKLNIIKGAKGYKKLNHLPFNREFSLRNKLVESIKIYGFIQPIVLCYSNFEFPDEEPKLYILDGQHRALAAQYLDVNFTAVILDYKNINVTQIINIVAKLNNSAVAWTLEDYCKAWHSLGKTDYTTLLSVKKNYGYTIDTLASILSGHITRQRVTDHVKEGIFKVTSKESTLVTLKLLTKTKRMNSRMLISFHRVRLTVDNFDFKVFKTKFEQQYEAIKAESYDDYFEIFKKLLN